jgi:hypothetical protein
MENEGKHCLIELWFKVTSGHKRVGMLTLKGTNSTLNLRTLKTLYKRMREPDRPIGSVSIFTLYCKMGRSSLQMKLKAG